MATPIILPRQGQSVESCIITEILVRIGDHVALGDTVLRYETDKAAFELEAEAEGSVIAILADEGDEVPVLNEVLVLGAVGEEYVHKQQKPEKKGTTSGQPATKTSDDTPISKSESAEAGITSQIEVSPDHLNTPISPRAKNLAQRLAVSYRGIKGSGPNGRIIERDIEALAQSGNRMSSLAASQAQASAQTAPAYGTGLGGRVTSSDLLSPVIQPSGEYTDTKLSNIRKIIAQNMQASLQNSAQLTHHMSADARALLSIRKDVKKKMEEENFENITLNDLICYALIQALKKMPEINSHFLGDSIRTFNHVNLGIAVDTDRGLMVPALQGADELDLPALSAALKSLANSCKNGQVDPDLLAPTAASFTVSNLGAFGVEMFTPVINLPQTGILGVNTIIQRPGDIGGGIIGFIPYLGLSLTYDHRALDGAPASAFLREVKEQIENLEFNL